MIFFAEIYRLFWLPGGKFLKKIIKIFRQTTLTQNPTQGL
jgi:hypothetical protein